MALVLQDLLRFPPIYDLVYNWIWVNQEMLRFLRLAPDNLDADMVAELVPINGPAMHPLFFLAPHCCQFLTVPCREMVALAELVVPLLAQHGVDHAFRLQRCLPASS